MVLEVILKILGWVFVLVPSIAFISVSFQMIKGAAGDDVTVKTLVLTGLTFFCMGVIMLLLLSLTDIFAAL